MFAGDERGLEIIKADPSIAPASVRVDTVDRATADDLATIARDLPEATIVTDIQTGLVDGNDIADNP